MKRRMLQLQLGGIALVLALSAVGCPCTDSVLNASPWLRWFVFAKFGADRVCEEMTRRGALVRADVPVPGFPPAVGRFFPQTCQSQLNDETRTLSIWMTGTGYAWTPATSKMAFEATVSVEYKPDFHKDDDEIYVWFDVVNAPEPQFKITHVEQRVTNVALQLYGVEWFANSLAKTFVSAQLGKGFTVIQDDDGQDFSLGKLAVGQRPPHPWDVEGSERYTWANETTEVRGNQQDFLGPYPVDKDKRALFIKMLVKGAPVDVFVMSYEAGQSWRMAYQTTSPPPGPPPGSPILQQAQSQPNGQFDGWVALPKGLYYIVIDNSASAGLLRPAAKLPTPFDPSTAQTATIDYLVQVGDRP